MTTQTAVNTFAVPGGGALVISNGYSFAFTSTTGVSFSVTKPDTTTMSFQNASMIAASDGFAIEFNEQGATIPAGSTISVSFPAGTIYWSSAAAKYQMWIYTYSYSAVDTSPWTAVFNSVTYHTNYSPDATYVQGGLSAAALSYVPSRNGYVLQGWSTSAGGAVVYAPNATFDFSLAADTPLYAVWAVAPNQTVTFNANDGSGSPSTTTQTRNTSAALTSNTFSRAGYTFAGWNTQPNGSGSNYTNGQSYNFASSMTLYAKWTGLTNVVTYDTHGGSSVANGSFLSGGTIATLPSAPTLAGYTFAGWFAAATGGTALSNGYAPGVITAITLHAHWTGNPIALTYDSHGGSAVSAGTFPTGGSISNLASAPTRSGYAFNGWFLAASGGTAITNGYSPGVTTPVTLHAQWTALAQTVTFDANGGLGTMTAQSSGSAANLTANAFSRNGYYFDGWNTAANGSGTDYANSASFDFLANATLYAKWRAIPLVPTASVAIQVPVGQPIANAPVALAADGLKDQTGYTVTVHSTPQIIDQGTIWSGRLNTTVRIPANLEAGWHRLVIEGTAADGTPWTETSYFQVSPTGILQATSDIVPAELAYTGNDVIGTASSAAGLLLLGFTLMAGNLARRRRQES